MYKFHTNYQRMNHVGGSAPKIKSTKTHEDGKVEEIEISSAAPLPDPSLFNLEANIKAKQNLNQVPTKVIDNGQVGMILNEVLENYQEPTETQSQSKEKE